MWIDGITAKGSGWDVDTEIDESPVPSTESAGSKLLKRRSVHVVYG
jgi:hypothetical protein